MSAIYGQTSDRIAHKTHVESTFSMRTEDGEKIGQTGHIIMMPADDSVEKLMDAVGM